MASLAAIVYSLMENILNMQEFWGCLYIYNIKIVAFITLWLVLYVQYIDLQFLHYRENKLSPDSIKNVSSYQ